MRRIDIVLVDRFPSLSLALVTEPLRVANRELTGQHFAWRLLSLDGEPVRSSSGLEISVDGGLDDRYADAVILLSSYEPEAGLQPTLIGWLQRRAVRGALMGCVDTAALVFAAAGLLTRHPAAVHHEAIEGFRHAFPDAGFTDHLFSFHPRRCSSAGGVATIDMTLALIAHYESGAVSRRVAEILNHVPASGERRQDGHTAEWTVPRVNRQLARCVELMIASIDQPLSLAALGAKLGLRDWQLRRLFLRYLQRTPGRFYRELRLQRAQDMLRNSHLPVGKVASACGYDNLETFTRAYRRQYGVAPSRDRRFPA